MSKKLYIISGGTISHIRPHLALCAPAYGKVGGKLFRRCAKHFKDYDIKSVHTKMAGGPVTSGKSLETNADVSEYVDELIADPETKVIFFPVALCDYEAYYVGFPNNGPHAKYGVGKDQPRLKTSDGDRLIQIRPADKIISKIRKKRKDIFLVAFKTTTNATEDEMFKAGMKLLKKNSCNLVLVNDIAKRMNMVLTPEMARYHVTSDRDKALTGLVEMAAARSGLTFSRTTVLEEGNSDGLLKLDDSRVPDSLRTVVNYCVENGAYKAFKGVTVGHFGFKYGEYVYSSRRKQNYNKPGGTDLVMVKFSDDSVVAYGAKPSAGVRSQNLLLTEKYDCVIHFHCPLRINAASGIQVQSQRQFECGSLECGKNTLDGMRRHGPDGFAAVMLDKHGPNLLFNKDIDPQFVIGFIQENFDLTKSTSD